jgi:hypothetical protein
MFYLISLWGRVIPLTRTNYNVGRVVVLAYRAEFVMTATRSVVVLGKGHPE